MKVILATIMVISYSFSAFAIDGTPFEVIGGAKLIATWNSDGESDLVKGKLSSGDEIIISTKQSALVVQAIHKKLGKELVVIDDYSEQSMMVSVYEYDFDKDGETELMVVDSPEFSIVNIHIFRYSNGLTELVGNLFGQFLISLEDDIISLPFGSQGLTDEYLYRNGSLFNLIYHDPLNRD
ncbi:MAG: hypothetical protein QE487_13780 [Fluviicola sp.]|nr:hypothetical protein [Fluviicola sp.]